MTWMCVFAVFPGGRNIPAFLFFYSMPTNSQHHRESPLTFEAVLLQKLGVTNAHAPSINSMLSLKRQRLQNSESTQCWRKHKILVISDQSWMLTCSNAARIPPKNESSHPVWHHQSPSAPADLFAEWHRCIYQLQILLFIITFFFFWVINHRYFLSSKQYVRQRKQEEELTLHRQNTKATESCGQLKPNLPEAGQLFVPLLMEQIVQDACTWNNHAKHIVHRIGH